MSSFYQVPRRYDFTVPYYEAEELPNKCQHLNDIIKKLILMKLSEVSDGDSIDISNDDLGAKIDGSVSTNELHRYKAEL